MKELQKQKDIKAAKKLRKEKKLLENTNNGNITTTYYETFSLSLTNTRA